MRVILLLLVVVAPAFAAPCADDSVSVCTPTEGKKAEILNILRSAYDQYNKAQIAASDRESAVRSGDAIRADDQNKAALAYEAKMNELFAQALTVTANYYHVGPAATSGYVVVPKDPVGRGAWSAGLQATWKPEVIFAPREVHAMTSAINTETHYGGGELDPTKIAGYTYPDGTVKVLAQTLFDALNPEHPEKANPGVIAAILDHEAQHFNDLLTRGFASKEDCELRAYTTELRDADAFELTVDQKAVIKAQKDKYDRDLKAGIKSGHLTSYFPDNKQEDDLSMEYDEAKRKALVFKRRSEELSRLADEERLRRKGEEHRRVIAEYQSAAAACGIEPTMLGDRTTGFAIRDKVAVSFTEPVNLAQGKAALLMANVCWFAREQQHPARACTDAIGGMQSGWGDTDFKHGLELDADAGDYEGCFHAIWAMPHAPQDIGFLDGVAARYWQDWKVQATRRMMETRREIARQQEETDRRSRNDEREARTREGHPHDDTWDLTPAYEALERARRSHF